MKNYIGMAFLALATLPFGAAATTPQGDPAAGAEKAQSCHACHGSDGLSINTMWPNLAGQKAGYLRKQMIDFRDGRRTDPVMVPLTTNLSDQDIADIAAHFSAM